jgi:hypothetical protein
MDVIPLDAFLIRGSHGCFPISLAKSPVCITRQTELLDSTAIEATDVCSLILQHLRNG